jgi:hypothetical protein
MKDSSTDMGLTFHAEVSTAETDYGMVLLDERDGRYWQLNPTGALVVRLLRDGATPAAAAHALAEEFRADRAQAEHDVHALLDGLRVAGLVVQ